MTCTALHCPQYLGTESISSTIRERVYPLASLRLTLAPDAPESVTYCLQHTQASLAQLVNLAGCTQAIPAACRAPAAGRPSAGAGRGMEARGWQRAREPAAGDAQPLATLTCTTHSLPLHCIEHTSTKA